MRIDADQGMTSHELIAAAQKGALQELHIDQIAPGTFVVRVRPAWRSEDAYWVGGRDRQRPRQFKNLDRLVNHIKTFYPQITVIHIYLHPEASVPALQE